MLSILPRHFISNAAIFLSSFWVFGHVSEPHVAAGMTSVSSTLIFVVSPTFLLFQILSSLTNSVFVRPSQRFMPVTELLFAVMIEPRYLNSVTMVSKSTTKN